MTDEKKVIVGVICASCASLEVLTKNSTAFGHVVAGTFCFLCFIVSGKAAYDHYEAAYNMGKNSAQSINQASKKTKEEFLKKLNK
jgi:hypothetical protein